MHIEVEYDSDDDALYVRLREPRGELHTEDFGHERYVDYDAEGNVVGIELLFVSQGLDLEGLPEAERLSEALKAIPRPV